MFNYKSISNHLSERQKFFVKKGLGKLASAWPAGENLTMLAIKHGTDKWTHGYIPKYEKYFSPLRMKKLKILEIGIGGYDDPQAGGESLRMWQDYFPSSTIYGIDLYDKQAHAKGGIKIFKGSQNDPEFLQRVAKEAGGFDIIIDDGSHVNAHVITSFQTLFPLLAQNGIYAIEDLHTAYVPKYGGCVANQERVDTSMGMLKGLLDGLNYQYTEGRQRGALDEDIVSIHFYPKMAFIFKGTNGKDPRACGS